jgi:hypothetical protein
MCLYTTWDMACLLVGLRRLGTEQIKDMKMQVFWVAGYESVITSGLAHHLHRILTAAGQDQKLRRVPP